jgi:hypothetical protein
MEVGEVNEHPLGNAAIVLLTWKYILQYIISLKYKYINKLCIHSYTNRRKIERWLGL